MVAFIPYKLAFIFCHITTVLPSRQWTPQGHRGRGRPRNTWKRDLEKEMWTAGSRYSWRNMAVETQDRTGWRQVICGL